MGLRIGDIEDLDWPDFYDGAIWMTRSVWQGQVGTTKSKKSTAPVPVIRQLAEHLEMQRLRQGDATEAPVFTNAKSKRLCLANLLKRTIVPTLKRLGIEWHGLARLQTRLGQQSLPDRNSRKVIQEILRHGNVAARG